MSAYLDQGAQLSTDGMYRYALWRRWDDMNAGMQWAMFIGLNPSTADGIDDDPTIRRCVAFAKSWGYRGLLMTNLYGFRATQPADMLAAADPIGPDNDRLLQRYAQMAGVIVAAWGNNSHLRRDIAVCELLSDHGYRNKLHYLKLNQSGSPAHPLYLSATLKPQPWVLS